MDITANNAESVPKVGWHLRLQGIALRYGVAVLATALAAGIRHLINPMLGGTEPFSFFFVAVAISAWLGGLGPALLAVLLGAACGFWLFEHPEQHFVSSESEELWELAIFIFVGAAIGFFGGAQRRARLHAMDLANRDLAQQQRLDRVLNQMADGFVIFDREWRYVYVNDRMAEITKRTREQLLGKVVWELFPDYVGHAAHVELQRALREQVPTSFEAHFASPDIWLACRAYPSAGGVTVYVGDATDRKRAERGHAETQKLNQAILQAALDGILTTDDQGIIESFNPAAEKQFGYRADEAIEQSIEILVPERFRLLLRHVITREASAERDELVGTGREVEGLRKDGTVFPMVLSISELNVGGRRILTGFIHDITDHKEHDRQRERMLVSERTARSSAEQANQSKDEFLATLSHELRTPLSAMLGWSQLLRSGRAAPGDLELGLESIERNARLQSQLIEDLLDTSRITSGKMRLEVIPVDLVELATVAIGSVEPAASAKQITLERSIAGEIPKVVGDPARLQQIVWNLLSNAIKFTPLGGLVRVSLRQTEGQIELKVSDTGVGIKPEFLPHLFQRFSQGDTSSTRRFGGLGLGLAIVRHLTELHGGTVYAASDGIGRGASFVVLFPIVSSKSAVESASPSPIPVTEVAAQDYHSLKGVRILVVDDQSDTRMLMERFLRHYDADVAVAASAEEAVQSVRASPPHVLVSDISMPDEDGYSLMRRVRAMTPAEGGLVPALALTAFARPEDRARALEAGFQEYLSKPVEPADLIAKVTALSVLIKA